MSKKFWILCVFLTLLSGHQSIVQAVDIKPFVKSLVGIGDRVRRKDIVRRYLLTHGDELTAEQVKDIVILVSDLSPGPTPEVIVRDWVLGQADRLKPTDLDTFLFVPEELSQLKNDLLATQLTRRYHRPILESVFANEPIAPSDIDALISAILSFEDPKVQEDLAVSALRLVERQATYSQITTLFKGLKVKKPNKMTYNDFYIFFSNLRVSSEQERGLIPKQIRKAVSLFKGESNQEFRDALRRRALYEEYFRYDEEGKKMTVQKLKEYLVKVASIENPYIRNDELVNVFDRVLDKMTVRHFELLINAYNEKPIAEEEAVRQRGPNKRHLIDQFISAYEDRGKYFTNRQFNRLAEIASKAGQDGLADELRAVAISLEFCTTPLEEVAQVAKRKSD